MLRASLFRLKVVITFLNSAVLGMLLALLSCYHYSVSDVNSLGSQFASYKLHEHNGSGRIASQLWHSHDVVCVHLIITSPLEQMERFSFQSLVFFCFFVSNIKEIRLQLHVFCSVLFIGQTAKGSGSPTDKGTFS